jgi:hypothetical protein
LTPFASQLWAAGWLASRMSCQLPRLGKTATARLAQCARTPQTPGSLHIGPIEQAKGASSGHRSRRLLDLEIDANTMPQCSPLKKLAYVRTPGRLKDHCIANDTYISKK